MKYQKVRMQKRKATVHFGPVRVVVPCPEETMTIGDLTEAAIQRYKKATGRIDSDVRVHRLECLRDGGILDPDDHLSDVFDETKDQILAIYDEQSPNGSGLGGNQIISPVPSSSYSSFSGSTPLMTSSPVMPAGSSRSATRPTSSYYSNSSPLYSGLGQSVSMDFPGRGYSTNLPPAYKTRDSVVEVKNANSLPSNGLMVYSPSDGAISSSPPVRSSLRSGSSTPSRTHRVTLSPEVEKKLNNNERSTSGRFARNSARKSRISESFYDAQEKLEELHHAAEEAIPSTAGGRARLQFLENAPNETIITFVDHDRTPMGIEVSGLFDAKAESSSRRPESTLRLKSVEITKIEPDGRVGRDGRLKIGDRILDIDGRPVSQMSIHRARAYIADLQEKPAPSLTVDRPISSFQDDPSLADRNVSANSSQRKPLFSALQKANTKTIGQTTRVDLTKSPAGFGFTVTGRETADGERLFYIGTVKPNGVALGHLRAGDRLLEINGEKTSDLTQPEVVDRLKRARVGETVTFLVSRVDEDDKEEKEQNEPPQEKTKIEPAELEEHEYVIPLNSTGSAGLGIRLKARVTIRSDKSREDCGIFVKSVLTGGAADKDNRLRVDDRIIAIEDIRLDQDTNSEASQKISGCFKSLGPAVHSVKIRIQRKVLPLTIDHDSHSHAVTATPSPISIGFSDEKRSSTASDIRGDELEIPSPEAFDREAPTRKSMSEKRGMGTTNDPSHLRLFQDIKHQRQTSAPPVSSSPVVASTRSASQRAAARARSHSVHPRSPPAQSQSLLQPKSNELGVRRSLSMESVNQAMPNERKDPSPHPYPPGTEITVERRENNVNRDRQRRKSVGSTVKSWFGFSKESTPEQSSRHETARQEEEDRRRVQAHYNRLRQQEADRNRNFSMASLPPREMNHYGEGTYQLPSPEQPLIISNSRFYASQRASKRPSQATMTTTSTIATRPIGTPKRSPPPPPPPVVPYRRPITTHFPVENQQPICNQAPIPLTRKTVPCRDEQHQTITTCSTPGSRIAGAEHRAQPLLSSLPMETRQIEEQQNRTRPDPGPGHHNSINKPNHRNSTLITFPTTRFAFAPSSSSPITSSGRVSMRARKNKSKESISPPHPVPPPPSRFETPIDDPSPKYCEIWNQWNIRTGASLPARRPHRPSRPRLNQTIFEATAHG